MREGHPWDLASPRGVCRQELCLYSRPVAANGLVGLARESKHVHSSCQAHRKTIHVENVRNVCIYVDCALNSVLIDRL